jgi:hypothetical protein
MVKDLALDKDASEPLVFVPGKFTGFIIVKEQDILELEGFFSASTVELAVDVEAAHRGIDLGFKVELPPEVKVWNVFH